MEKEKLLKICKIIHRVTLIIGLLTFVLPIAFWSKIPDVIPIHYGVSGTADDYSEKSALILLFFATAMLMGVMNIAIYYVKTSATSKYATEAEKSQLDTVYPMIIFMNLGIQVMFAYMMFCCTTGRNLGILFLPIFLIATFLPIAFIIFKKKQSGTKLTTALEKYKMMEAQEEGIVYRSKVDWWLGLLLGGSVGFMVYLTLMPIVKGEGVEWVITISTIFVLLLVLPLFAIKYVLYSKHLHVSCGIYGKIRVPYEAISSVKATHNPLSSAALSLDRIQIDYTENGYHQMVLISPVRKKEFMKKIEEYRS